ncbi:MAG TPA: hypothetical protein VNV60_12205 [Holophagaceae bacterium]|nr:hypothetical protein [Holophagaceae bacterium]
MAKTTLMIASLLLAAPLLAQSRQASSFAQASARILLRDSYVRMGGYDPATEVQLSGRVEQAGGGLLRMRMAFGMVTVELGEAGRNLVLRPGELVQVIVSKVMQGSSQRLLTRELRMESKVVELRDVEGLPLREAAQG